MTSGTNVFILNSLFVQYLRNWNTVKILKKKLGVNRRSVTGRKLRSPAEEGRPEDTGLEKPMKSTLMKRVGLFCQRRKKKSMLIGTIWKKGLWTTQRKNPSPLGELHDPQPGASPRPELVRTWKPLVLGSVLCFHCVFINQEHFGYTLLQNGNTGTHVVTSACCLGGGTDIDGKSGADMVFLLHSDVMTFEHRSSLGMGSVVLHTTERKHVPFFKI